MDKTILKNFEGPVKLKDMQDGTTAEVVFVAEQPGQAHGVAGLPVTSADASTVDFALTDAPGAGLKVVLDQLVISSGAAIALTFKEETSGIVVLGPIYMAANSTQVISLRSKKLPTVNKKLVVRTSGAGSFSVDATYRKEA